MNVENEAEELLTKLMLALKYSAAMNGCRVADGSRVHMYLCDEKGRRTKPGEKAEGYRLDLTRIVLLPEGEG